MINWRKSKVVINFLQTLSAFKELFVHDIAMQLKLIQVEIFGDITNFKERFV